MEPSFVRSNKASRDRLLTLIENLEEDSLQQKISDEWTIAATLAHIAFWDRMCIARWDAYEAGGSLEDVPDHIIDLVNAANLPTWLTISGKTAVDLVRQAMDDLDDRIANLPETAERTAGAGGFIYLLDRLRHRNEHATEIEAAL